MQIILINKTKKSGGKMQIIEKKIGELKPYEKNPRRNDNAVDYVAKSIEQFGFKVPIVIDKNNVIVAGHTRYKAAKKLGLKTVPCIIADDLADEQIKAFRLADNKTAELSEWDFDLLNDELDGIFDIDMRDFGFDSMDFGSDGEKEIVEDEPPEIDEDSETICKFGDIWQLGEHRLMCGDSTDREQVEMLMNGEKADMVFTDPPYNVAIGSKNAFLNSVQKAGRCCEDIANDKGMTDEEIGQKLWKPVFENLRDYAKDDCSLYVTMPQGDTHMMMMMMMIAANWQVKHELMWLKNSPTFSMGRLDYDYKHEPICYGWAKSHNFYGKGKFTKSVWEIDKPKHCDLHPTMKPIELISNAILNSSKQNDLITDFFGGSGSTLIACEQLDRKCYMMELSEKYCSVIIKRWEDFTGKKAVKIDETEN